jgi:hypothetical protein
MLQTTVCSAVESCQIEMLRGGEATEMLQRMACTVSHFYRVKYPLNPALSGWEEAAEALSTRP